MPSLSRWSTSHCPSRAPARSDYTLVEPAAGRLHGLSVCRPAAGTTRHAWRPGPCPAGPEPIPQESASRHRHWPPRLADPMHGKSCDGKPLMIPLSILDLAPVCEGSDTTAAFANMLELAQHADALGYRRYWLAEHHNMPGIASAATGRADRPAVAGAHQAHPRRCRRHHAALNHAPLQVAEQFGTLASLYPDRIDLGLGRAPGTDQPTARALRRYFDQLPTSSRRTCASCCTTSSRCNPARPCRRFPAAACAYRPGYWVRACSVRAWPPRWACRTRSPRISPLT